MFDSFTLVHRHNSETLFTMAAAAAVPRALFSTLYGDGSFWELPNPDFVPLSTCFGTGMVADAVAIAIKSRNGLAGTATCSPTVVAFMTTAECDAIFVAQSLSPYPAEYTNATDLDDRLVGLIGDNPASII
jgi:hypothetical protein